MGFPTSDPAFACGGDTVGFPSPAINLLLCRYATTVDNRLFLNDAGLVDAPPSSRFDWYIAGALDLPVAAIREGGQLRVVDDDGQVIDDEKLSVDFRTEFDSDTDLDEVDSEAMARVNVAVRLPDVSGRIEKGIYAWRVSFGSLSGEVPFVVHQVKEPEVLDAEV